MRKFLAIIAMALAFVGFVSAIELDPKIQWGMSYSQVMDVYGQPSEMGRDYIAYHSFSGGYYSEVWYWFDRGYLLAVEYQVSGDVFDRNFRMLNPLLGYPADKDYKYAVWYTDNSSTQLGVADDGGTYLVTIREDYIEEYISLLDRNGR